MTPPGTTDDTDDTDENHDPTCQVGYVPPTNLRYDETIKNHPIFFKENHLNHLPPFLGFKNVNFPRGIKGPGTRWFSPCRLSLDPSVACWGSEHSTWQALSFLVVKNGCLGGAGWLCTTKKGGFIIKQRLTRF